jgi:hypothetical protein
LNWKYVDQPGQDFQRLDLVKDGTTVGVAALSVTQPGGAYRYSRGEIVDLVVSPERADDVNALLFESVECLRRAGADLVLCDLVNPQLVAHLHRFGFRSRGATRYFLIATEGLDPESVAVAKQSGNWLITHGDSDIDRPW